MNIEHPHTQVLIKQPHTKVLNEHFHTKGFPQKHCVKFEVHQQNKNNYWQHLSQTLVGSGYWEDID